ncbi:amino acid permease [Yoonia maritima]|uniref:Amino acid permease n=1 Tax=Yoonia maritima TaxID=1435347 RepID=A0A2T0VZ13_9RHOB|nr:amino acid permease [Yoonia maritima]PRY77573.1 amino acid permease [Yoonia maritima]
MPSDTTTPELRRAIGLPLLVLYGLGITIGAGIYVLIGEAAAAAGVYAPAAFLVAAGVMTFSALSFAEFSGRIPLSAGEAVYVEAGFGWSWLTLGVGLSIIFAATIAGAAISLGCAGYVAELVPLPEPIIVTAIILTMGWIAAKGVQESVTFAGVLTVIEILGLLVIIYAGYRVDPAMMAEINTVIPPISDGFAMTGVLSASLIAFFAFIGFDNVVNLAEEARNPRKIMPWAIGISLAVVTVIYFFVMLVAVRALPQEELIASKAPIGLLFERLTGMSPFAITLIAIVATMNGVVIEIIMAARVAYGLAKGGKLPTVLGRVDPKRRTPLNATIIITSAMLVSALIVPLDFLVSLTSQIILAIFVLVNMALVRVKWRGDPVPDGIFTVPIFIPVIGAISCLFLLIGPIWIN